MTKLLFRALRGYISIWDFWDLNMCARTVQWLDNEFIILQCLRLTMQMLKQRSSSSWCSACGARLTGARHINPLFIHKQDRCVDGYGYISPLHTLIPEADGLEFSMWHRLPGLSHRWVLKRVIVSICSVSSFSCSATIVALSTLSGYIFPCENIFVTVWTSGRQLAALGIP